jgi:hypothetical protein
MGKIHERNEERKVTEKRGTLKTETSWRLYEQIKSIKFE